MHKIIFLVTICLQYKSTPCRWWESPWNSGNVTGAAFCKVWEGNSLYFNYWSADFISQCLRLAAGWSADSTTKFFWNHLPDLFLVSPIIYSFYWQRKQTLQIFPLKCMSFYLVLLKSNWLLCRKKTLSTDTLFYLWTSLWTGEMCPSLYPLLFPTLLWKTENEN